ncbi:MAG TPA: TonB-dependent receptor [Bryobacteraceae bacterium]|nr:TonB-dependent receptor [Bryobacteraceae bacterium]
MGTRRTGQLVQPYLRRSRSTATTNVARKRYRAVKGEIVTELSRAVDPMFKAGGYLAYVNVRPAAALLLVAAAVVCGQTATSILTGTVVDATGAVIQSAHVKVVSLRTGAERTVLSSETGDYRVPALQAGDYSLAVSAPGFRTEQIARVPVEVNQTARVNVTLTPGAVAESVQVEGVVPLLNADTAALGQVIDTKGILELPLNGRQFLQLALLAPGVTTGNGGPQSGTSSLFQRPGQNSSLSVSGGRAQNNNFLLDGTINTDGNVNAYVISPSVEAIQEFRVETSNYSAEFGRSSAGQINIVTKSGGNDFHGSLFHFFRNDALDARPFNNPGPLPKYRYNQFGGTLGGPVLKNSTFFFLNYEGRRIVQGESRIQAVPGLAQRQGDFSGTPAIYDPETTRPDPSDPTGMRLIRDQFPGNRIPLSRQDLVARRVLEQLVPLPNLPGTTNNLLDTRNQRSRDNQSSGRIDQRIGSGGFLFGRHTVSNETSFVPSGLPGSGTNSLVRAQHFTLSETHTFSSTVVNELRLGYARLRLERLSENAFRRDIVGELGIPGVQFGGPQVWGIPSFSIPGYSAFGDDNFFLPMRQRNNTYQVLNTLALTRGGHNLRIGGEFRRFQFNIIQIFTPRGDFRFNANFTTQTAGTGTNDRSGDALASFLLGLPVQQRRTVGTANAYLRQSSFAGFLQDDWKVHRDLTLNLGLRYEYAEPFHDKYDRLSNVSFANVPTLRDAAAAPGTYDVPIVLAGRNGTPRGLTRPDGNNWGPRFGLAWRPFGSTDWAVRLGAGLFYAAQDAEHYGRTSINLPFVQSDIQDSNAFIPEIRGIGFTIPPQIGGTPLRQVFIGIDENLRTPYTQQWNLAVQRRMSSNVSAEVAYVGSISHKLDTRNAYNDAIPASGSLDTRRPHQRLILPDVNDLPPGIVPTRLVGREVLAGTIENQVNRVSANYHAMHARADWRYRSGLSWSVSHTWAKAISDGNSYRRQGTQGELAQDFLNVSERALTGYDVRHRFVANALYELPVCRTTEACFGSRAARWLLGGWQINGIFQAQTGFPFTVLLANATANNGRSTRPNVVPGVSPDLPSDQRTTSRWFNTSAFVAPPPFTLGNSAVNNVTGPGLWSLDGSLFKNAQLAEKWRVQFRAEFFNALNHVNLGQPNALLGSPQFGTVTSQSLPPRQIQFALKLLF